MAGLFHEIIYRPLFNILVFIYQNIPWQDMGVAVIILTILIRILLLPVYRNLMKSQQEMQEIQPELKELREKYKDDRQTQSEEMMKLYKDRGINPFAPFWPLLIQLPILIGMISVARNIFNSEEYPESYGFVDFPETFNEMAFGAINIVDSGWDSQDPYVIIMAVTVSIILHVQMKLVMGRANGRQEEKQATEASSQEVSQHDEQGQPDATEMAQMMQKQMMYVLPFIILIPALTLPAIGTIYIFTASLFHLGQEIFIKQGIKEFLSSIRSS